MRDELFRKVPSMRDEFNHFILIEGFLRILWRNLHGMIIGKHSKLLPKSANMRLAQAENLTKNGENTQKS